MRDERTTTSCHFAGQLDPQWLERSLSSHGRGLSKYLVHLCAAPNRPGWGLCRRRDVRGSVLHWHAVRTIMNSICFDTIFPSRKVQDGLTRDDAVQELDGNMGDECLNSTCFCRISLETAAAKATFFGILLSALCRP